MEERNHEFIVVTLGCKSVTDNLALCVVDTDYQSIVMVDGGV